MAEAKNTAETKDKARVLAGTFPAAATDQAKKLLSGMEAAGLKGYKMGAAPDLPHPFPEADLARRLQAMP